MTRSKSWFLAIVTCAMILAKPSDAFAAELATPDGHTSPGTSFARALARSRLDPDEPTVWTVNSTSDEAGDCTPESCTLRAAIAAANASAGTDLILFDIPTEDPGYDPETGYWTIGLETTLPEVGDDGTFLDALSPPDPGEKVPFADSANALLAGSANALLADSANALLADSANALLADSANALLAPGAGAAQAAGAGSRLAEGASDAGPATMERCGSRRVKVTAGSASYGFEITAANVELTGFSIQSAGIHGVYIHGGSAQNTQLLCNEISGSSSDGVHIAGSASGAWIGSEPGLGNVISGNGDDGIEITGGAHHVTITGNYVGTTAAGDAAWPNAGFGVRIRGTLNNSAGLNVTGGGNLISGNTLGGVLIDGSADPADENVVFNNLIGTNAGSTAAIPNEDGIILHHAADNEINSNVVAANLRDGVTIDGSLATDNIVAYNFIGLDPAEQLSSGNGRWGVLVDNEASDNQIALNDIRKNGYTGDYPVSGGVGILSGSSDNRLWMNTIDLNGGDGVYINSSDRNHVDENFIHDNTLLGINLESGGNQDLPPPQIQQYRSKGTKVEIQATACAGCKIQIFSDDDGEGRYFETELTADATTGAITYTGTPAGKVFTMTATDAMKNTSEFSASPVFLDLSIDDALPHVVVNKVPGDADGHANKTLVEFTTYVVSYDPSLTKALELELQIPSDLLGAPTRVFYRDDLSSLDGTAITNWTNPSSGRYRVSGVGLLAGKKSGEWTRRVVFRFAMPHSTLPLKYAIYAYLNASNRTVSRKVDWAILRVLKKAEGIVITNRTLLFENKYRNYHNPHVAQLLQGVYSMAQGKPYNHSPLMAVYYVDAYSAAARTWNNTTVNYSQSELLINTAANSVNHLKEDWVEDSTSKWLELGCLHALDRPQWLVIVGDDDVIPFYRRSDPTDDEEDSVENIDAVVNALQAADYMFTDNGYANFSADTCGRPWYQGGADLYTGRIVGGSAFDMLNFINNGMSGPATGSTNRAVAVSYGGFNVGRLAGYMKDRGFNVLNDQESPETINNSDWRKADLMNIIKSNQGYAALAHQGHANSRMWGLPEDEELAPEDINSGVAWRVIASRRPFVTSCGCRSGLSLGLYYNRSMVNAWVSAGASGVVGSTALTRYHPFYTSPGVTWDMEGEQLLRNYWYYLVKVSPGFVSSGSALVMAKRNFGYGWFIGADEEKMATEFTLYGLPWVGIYGTVGGSAPSEPSKLPGHQTLVPSRASPEVTLAGTYSRTYPLDASNYSITDADGFDIVQVEGLGWTYGDEAPIVPLSLIEMPLPMGASIEEVTVFREGETDLGALNIPMYTPALPVPGGDPGGYSPTPADYGLFPAQPYSTSVIVDGTSQLARVHVIPLEYDPATDQTTLFQDLTVQVDYDLAAKVALLDLVTDEQDPAPGAPFAVQATLLNASDEAVELTGSLTLEDEYGAVVATEDVLPFDVPPGEEVPWERAWVAPAEEGGYRLELELWHEGESQAFGWLPLGVAGGRITGLEVPEGLQPGQPAPFLVTFANARDELFEGDVMLSIHDAAGALLATLEAPLPVPGQGQASVELIWEAGAAGPGGYSASARVVDQGGTASYGPVSRPFQAVDPTFLPLVLRSD